MTPPTPRHRKDDQDDEWRERETVEDVDIPRTMTLRTGVYLIIATVTITASVVLSWADTRMQLSDMRQEIANLKAPRPDAWTGTMQANYESQRFGLANTISRIDVRAIQAEYQRLMMQ